MRFTPTTQIKAFKCQVIFYLSLFTPSLFYLAALVLAALRTLMRNTPTHPVKK